METVFIISASFVATIALLVQAIKYWLDSKTTVPLAIAQNHAFSSIQKKYPHADLTNYEGLFLKTGFVVTIVYCIIIFSLMFYQTKLVLPPTTTPVDEIDIIDMPVTYIEKKEIPPVIKPEMKTPEVNIVLVDKEVEATKEDKLTNEEIDETTTTENTTRFVVPIEDEMINEAPVPLYMLTEKPEYPGGENALLKFIAQCPFSNVCKENDISGVVHVGFTISKTGEVKDLKILRSPNKCFEAEVLNHMKKMRVWTPGKQNGKPVNVTYHVPLQFTLNDR
jgi:protein TonB